jgi:serine protease Do
LNGNVIGVNSAIFSPTGGNVGIGFAIPAQTANTIVRQILRSGRVTRGWIGVSIQGLDDDLARSLGLEDTRGALVGSVVPDGPAARGGLQQGDVILSLNGSRIEDNRDLTQRIGATGVGDTARVEVLRGGQRRTLNVRLGERPSEQQLAADNSAPSAPTPEVAPQGGVAQSSLGMSVRPLTQADRTRFELGANAGGLVITSVVPSSDAASKFIQAGDVILQAGGRAIRTPQELSAAADAARRANRPLLLQIDGQGGRRFVAVDVAE